MQLKCGKCGAELPQRARFCSKCGTPVAVQPVTEQPAGGDTSGTDHAAPAEQAGTDPAPARTAADNAESTSPAPEVPSAGPAAAVPAAAPVEDGKKASKMPNLLSVIILIAVIWFAWNVWPAFGVPKGVRDVQNMTFGDGPLEIGEAADENLKSVKWSSSKNSKDNYTVVLRGKAKETKAPVELYFDVQYYSDGTVEATVTKVRIDDTYYDGALMIAMAIEYVNTGELDTDAFIDDLFDSWW